MAVTVCCLLTAVVKRLQLGLISRCGARQVFITIQYSLLCFVLPTTRRPARHIICLTPHRIELRTIFYCLIWVSGADKKEKNVKNFEACFDSWLLPVFLTGWQQADLQQVVRWWTAHSAMKCINPLWWSFFAGTHSGHHRNGHYDQNNSLYMYIII